MSDMEELKEKIARAMYELDPILEQATDLDNRPTGKPFAIGWGQLAEIDDGYHEHYKDRAAAALRTIEEAGFAIVPADLLKAADNPPMSGVEKRLIECEPELSKPLNLEEPRG